jgi:short-subunit dehydrogenase
VRTMIGPPGDERLRNAVDGKVVLVTGASAGVGKAVARAVGAGGATVLLVARSADKLTDLQAEMVGAGGLAYAYPCDMSDVEAVEALAARVLEEHEVVDVVVNNAGKSIRRSLELSYDRYRDFDRTMAVNYSGPVRLMLALLPAMREQGDGHVVNISTLGVQNPSPRYSAYLASKAAFDTWVRCVAPELRGDGVDFTSMYFGLVHTRMSAATTMYRYMPGLTPAKAAEDVCWALVRRPLTAGPAWAKWMGVVGDVARGPVERLLGAYYRASNDSASAGGEGDIEIPVLGAWLERAGLR